MTQYILCDKCNVFTEHSLIHEEKRDTSEQLDEDTWLSSETTYKILRCNGCKDISFVYEYQGDDDREVSSIPYPKRTRRKTPAYLNALIWNSINGKTDINGMPREIYTAYTENSYRLAAMGIRPLIELIMIEQLGDSGSFQKNIEKFYDERHINKAQREKLIQLIDIGSAVIHRAAKPDREIIDEMLDVLENIVESIYVSKDKLHKAYEQLKRK